MRDSFPLSGLKEFSHRDTNLDLSCSSCGWLSGLAALRGRAEGVITPLLGASTLR